MCSPQSELTAAISFFGVLNCSSKDADFSTGFSESSTFNQTEI